MKVTGYALATYVNGDGSNAHPGIEVLMKATGLSRSSVLRSLSALESEGFIVAVSRGGGKGTARGNATIYALSVPVDNSGRHRKTELP
jgi:DNA-binding transcriptional MocR family regulator